MDQNQNEILPSVATTSNLGDYEEARSKFQWEEVEKHFSWYTTGKVNMAYEAIDRHVAEGRGDKKALLYSDAARDESYTFGDLKEQSDKFGNVLRKYGIGKGDRVFIFMPRSPELYFSLMGILKVGAVVGPLFEAFMETAVKDRLEDSGAVALVTTSQLLGRVKRDELPELKHIFVVGDQVEEDGQIHDYFGEMKEASSDLSIEWLDRNDGLIMHYTSGSTGNRKASTMCKMP
ncbi:Acetyl-coenzyme A synthetase [Paenibacillus sp. P1XP2]|nr:Acetyl-coenzyme A synthetase [Paenibacillus sp. P1XP2]